MNVRHRPKRFLIGMSSVLAVAGAGLLTACHGSSSTAGSDGLEDSSQSTMNVKRTRYDNQAQCERQWPDAKDCRLVEAVRAGSSGQVTATSMASAAASPVIPVVVAPDAKGVMRVDHPLLEDKTGWYGPYYTIDGVVYHATGLAGIGKVPPDPGDDTSDITVRDCALQSGYGAFERTPKAEAEEEALVISRGGFLCPRSSTAGGHAGGSGGGGHGGSFWSGGGEEGGGHGGGGEGGGHGGGGHGSGGG